MLPANPFSDDGTLSPAVETVMTVDAAQMKELNATLARLLADYVRSNAPTRSALTSRCRESGRMGRPSRTVLTDAGTGRGVKTQFESALLSVLGEPTRRAGLAAWPGLAGRAVQRFWEPAENDIGVIHHGKGDSYNVSVQSGEGNGCPQAVLGPRSNTAFLRICCRFQMNCIIHPRRLDSNTADQ